MVHSGEKPFKCNQCGYATRNSSDLKKKLDLRLGISEYNSDQSSEEQEEEPLPTSSINNATFSQKKKQNN